MNGRRSAHPRRGRREPRVLAALALIVALGPRVDATTSALGGSPVTPIAVEAGRSHTCSVLDNGGVQCWGDNGSGELGNGTTTDSVYPAGVHDLTDAVSIAAGDEHNCVVQVGGSVSCWGYNGFGQVGDGSTSNQLLPESVRGVSGATAVAAGYAHSCAIVDAGEVVCWGLNDAGQLGDGTTINRARPVGAIGVTGATAITAGFRHTCVALSDGTGKCWGYNLGGAVGDGSTFLRVVPVPVEGLSGLGAVASVDTRNHVCALADAGGVWCWGANGVGQLGDGTETTRLAPVAVVGLDDARAVAAHESHSCAALDGGGVKCWGSNRWGQIGDGTTIDRPLPRSVLDMTDAQDVAAGGDHTCALLSDGVLQCWGKNVYGQLGDGTTDDRVRPVNVVASATVPAPPMEVVAGTDGEVIDVQWEAPDYDGGMPITGYSVVASPAGPGCSSAGLSCSVVGADPDVTYTFRVYAENRAGLSAGSLASNPISLQGSGYTGLSPARLMETRPGLPTVDGLYAGAGRLRAQETVNLRVVGRGGVPALGVAAVALNVTVTEPTAPSYLTVFPAGASRPTASNLNFVAGQTIPNMVIATVGVGGEISVFNFAGTTHVVVDVAGWFATGDPYAGLSPARLMDTRPGMPTHDGLFSGGGAVGPDRSVDLTVVGRAGVPATGIAAVALNITVTEPTAVGYVTVFPAGEGRPLASNLNFTPGVTIPNMVIATVGDDGEVSLYNFSGSTHLVVDVAGWFPIGDAFTGLSPARLMETRPGLPTDDGQFAGDGPLGWGDRVELTVVGRGGVPATGVAAVVLNVTVTAPTASGYLTVFPAGTSRPTASNLNFTAGQTIPNMVIATVGAGGQISLFNLAGLTHVVVDVAGWFPA